MKHLTPQEAYDALQADPNALLIDCPTEIEHFYVGHPVDSINIEWNTAPDFEVNPHFADEVLRMAGRKERPIVLICRSGKRTLDAGAAENGFFKTIRIGFRQGDQLDTWQAGQYGKVNRLSNITTSHHSYFKYQTKDLLSPR